MGLLARLTGKTAPPKKASDDVLLLVAMLLMAGADGVIEQGEFASVGAFASTLPEFRGRDLRATSDEAIKTIRRYKTVQEAVDALRGLSSDAVKRKCFVVCADIAMSSGDVDEAEDKLLEAMQETLGLDDALAAKVLEVLSLKYAT
jgi:thioredoxin-like negative regulator of GroEL